jgi:hypothetical protein
MIVISDSVALIGLSAIGALDLLNRLYGTVIVPDAVYQEVVVQGAGKPGAQAVAAASWIQVMTVRNKPDVNQLMNVIKLDRGESEAIVLAQEIGADLILLDEDRARRYARQQQLSITGTAGVLLAAKQQGLIPLVRPLLDALIAAGIFIGSALYNRTCQLAGE